jgi:uroporphyrinogen decarboxylase
MRQEAMTSRQRVVAALNHQETDRVPIDLGSTWCSTTTISFYERLKEYFGIDSPTVLMERTMQVCMIDERILQELHVDTRFVCYNPPDLVRNRAIELGENLYQDPWGIQWIKPPTSHYYDLYRPPLAGEITTSDILSHPWPEPYDPGYTRGLRERVQKMRDETDCAVVLNLSLWVLQCSQNVRGYEDWFVDLIRAPQLIECMADCITESLLGPLETVTDAVGDLVDAISVSDDIGHQDRLCMSPATYRKIFKPRHAQLMEAITSRSDKPIMWHTCGSVYDILDDLIEIGVDSLNPVQTTAKNMEAERLKRDYGDRLSFWGGIDTMHILNRGTPEDVRREVKYKIDTLAPGGGYILNPVHNVQPDVPVENLLAMIDATLEYGWFPLDGSEQTSRVRGKEVR